ncbi:cell division protein DivIB [Clostridium pasteurianum DSM 525 = ATCC 6013]|uniref:Cell division protein DivIB n=1 Tax=Clostridium pasteurianum DSM 525 = ATCC 6013 TaxID=1262449 RepID=A0A0H3J387_CLOPA|nr:FtsQ-type POTRA domain-containing protein [Clostridium pasteurianum]AJA47929.1 cell division protein DivIB [Clostridium pasteurianum DSM 525 = ATCC 6013]AJA51917.1 cell division protein DivIB [Clostridium pasteurianum DSM 525 = ATCC 6013]AOZ75216.1 cell division protein FtsQ [Clostridium pasteurianum DSM 525 = ATCC 6013]AOZ79011.1 cell division protein FtsQ [Clostridium pasteurianum]ELP59832.1 cell division protein FtsQ [Clostridium pasteurianum DSM 525 = ATCC 6013]
MEKSKNELIEKRRKKRRFKRVFFIMILLIAVLVTLCLKLTYFNIKYINVSNNYTIASEEIVKESGIQKNTNIFYMNSKNIKNNILNNPYILSVDIHKKLPNTININVNERKAVFYAQNNNNKFAVIDRAGTVLEIKDNIDNMNLIKIVGIDTSKISIGKVVLNDNKKLYIINSLTDIIMNNQVCKNIKVVNITDTMDLETYYNNMCIKLGSSENLQKKLNRAINIINDRNLSASKGYVDVSFNGNPVFFVEK